MTGIRVLSFQERTNYPVNLSVDDYGEEFALTVQTDRRIDARKLVGYVRTALESLVRAPRGWPCVAKCCGCSVLPQAEREQLLERFNATRVRWEGIATDPREVRGAGQAHTAARGGRR